MNKINVFVVLSLLSLVISSYAQDRRLCGFEISNFLSDLCHGFINAPNKKAHLLSGNDKVMQPKTELEDMLKLVDDFNRANALERERQMPSLSFPFINRFRGNSMIPNRFKRSPGIVEECCHKSCSLGELISYCG